ncbi:hypothetical protein LZC95_49970 [Pendulispora brunnea]|uniref:ATP-dependent DNA helicase RecG C-terminal domain-containing protein n=1 Tax=Pendulispora brunnea TaxID=2905690 RepID=A0ABZ2K768_9BACT
MIAAHNNRTAFELSDTLLLDARAHMDSFAPMSNLKNEINRLAETFAQGVLAAIRGASLDEISGGGDGRARSSSAKAPEAARGRGSSAPKAPGAKRGGRLHRRSEEELGAIGDNIIALLKNHPEGLRAEQIRAELNLDAKELPRPIKDLLAAKKLKTKGQKRATTYFAK